MWPFGPKKPCEHCRRDVRKPRDLRYYLCPYCGEPGPWATPEQVLAWTNARDARRQYALLLNQLQSEARPSTLESPLRDAASRTQYTQDELEQLAVKELNSFSESLLADGVFTDEEDHRLNELIPTLGLTWDVVGAKCPDLADRIAIARANAGRLPIVSGAGLLVKDGEVVHAQYPASLMKEVTLREWQAGSQGISIPLGKGFRYRVGTTRGHSVVVGTQIQVADTGTLSVTSRRAVFAGTRKTLEFQYGKLAGLKVYSNAIQLNVTNRQTASLIVVTNGEVVAAHINAAAQRLDHA